MAVEQKDSFLAEQAVIGAMLIDDRCIGEVLRQLEERDFLLDADRKIFRQIKSLFRARKPIDGITVAESMSASPGERSYLAQLIELTPTSANVLEYVSSQKRIALRDRLRVLGQELHDAEDLDICREIIAQLGQEVGGSRDVDMWTMQELLESFQADQTAAGSQDFVNFGFSFLDAGANTEKGDVVVIGGEPSAGKSALALQLAYHMAKRYRVGFFSLETNKKKLRDRLVTSAMGIDFSVIKNRALSEEDWQTFAAESGDFCQRDLRVIRAGSMTAPDIESVSRAMDFEVIFVDYLQLVVPKNGNIPRSEQVAEISRSLHNFAQATNTLVVELSQFSRSEKSGNWKEPTMHDLKESGQIEQDADMILLVFAPGPKSEFKHPERIRILKVAKNKEGRLGRWPMYFDGEHQHFSLLDGSPEDAMLQMQKMRDRAKLTKQQRSSQSEVFGQTKFIDVDSDGSEPF